MKKIVLLIIIVLVITGCEKNNNDYSNEKFEQRDLTYTIGEEKVLVKAVPAKKAYTEKKKEGKTTSWGRKSRYVVGKDIKPGYYDVESKGWASYGIYVFSLDLDLDSTKNYNYYGSISLVPSSSSVCYINDSNGCNTFMGEYKKIKGLLLVKGDKLYVNYTRDSMQNIQIRFVAKERKIKHPATKAKPEIKTYPIKIKESIKKYNNNNKCFINDYETDCSSLKNYDEIMNMF